MVSRSRISPTKITFGAPAQQRQRKIRRVAVQFALVHGRALVVVQELDFDGDDVIFALAVDAVE
jgi:hypothetical protein